jgi:hypothetical protein
MSVVAGDVNRSGAVPADHVSDVKRRFLSATSGTGSAAGGYRLVADGNGSGSVLADDFSEVKKRFFGTLPAAEPTAPVAVTSLRH